MNLILKKRSAMKRIATTIAIGAQVGTKPPRDSKLRSLETRGKYRQFAVALLPGGSIEKSKLTASLECTAPREN